MTEFIHHTKSHDQLVSDVPPGMSLLKFWVNRIKGIEGAGIDGGSHMLHTFVDSYGNIYHAEPTWIGMRLTDEQIKSFMSRLQMLDAFSKFKYDFLITDQDKIMEEVKIAKVQASLGQTDIIAGRSAVEAQLNLFQLNKPFPK
jgi:hypothetical protein